MITMSSNDLGSNLRAFQIALIVIPTIAIILRFWSRTVSYNSKHFRYWWDDWVALVALPFSIGANAGFIYYVHVGLGRHIETIPFDEQVQGFQVLFAVHFVYYVALSLTKSSALFFYARVFTTNDRRYRLALWTTQGLILGWTIAIVIATVFLCIPVEKAWLPRTLGHCQDTRTFWMGSSISCVIIDIIVLLLPMPALWNLQLKLARKIFVTCVLVCGYGVVVISIGRMVTLAQAGPVLEEDPTFNAFPTIYWQGAEAPVSILCICLPSIFSLAKRGFQDGLSSLFTSRDTSLQKRLKKPNQTDAEVAFPPGSKAIKLDRLGDSSGSLTRSREASLAKTPTDTV